MDWTMQGGSPSSSYRVDEEVRFPLKLAWKSETGMKAPPMSETLIVGNRVLVKTWKVVSGLDLATGERLWQVACLPIQITAENFIKTAMAAWGSACFSQIGMAICTALTARMAASCGLKQA